MEKNQGNMERGEVTEKKIEMVYVGPWGERSGEIAKIFLQQLGHLPK